MIKKILITNLLVTLAYNGFSADSTLIKTSTYTYNSKGQLFTVVATPTSSNATTTTYYYDSLGRISSRGSAGQYTGITTKYYYSVNGLLDSEVVVGHAAIYYYYNEKRQKIYETDDTNDSTFYYYAGNGNLSLIAYRNPTYKTKILYIKDTLIDKRISFSSGDTSRNRTQVYVYENLMLKRVDTYTGTGTISSKLFYSYDSLKRVILTESYTYSQPLQDSAYILNASIFEMLLPVRKTAPKHYSYSVFKGERAVNVLLNGRNAKGFRRTVAANIIINDRKRTLSLTSKY